MIRSASWIAIFCCYVMYCATSQAQTLDVTPYTSTWENVLAGDESTNYQSSTTLDSLIDTSSDDSAGAFSSSLISWKEFLKDWNATTGTWSNSQWKASRSTFSNYTVYYVRASGDDSNNGLDKNHAFRTIYKALQQNLNNAIVIVGAGTYQHTDQLTKSGLNTSLNTSTLLAKNNGRIGTLFYADTSGKFTGDAGSVNIMAPKNKQSVWTLYFTNCFGVAFSGFNFVEDPTSTTTDYNTSGLDYSQQMAAGYYPAYGALTFGESGHILLHNTTISKHIYGFHAWRCVNVRVQNGSFSDTRYINCYPWMSAKFVVDHSKFQNTNPKTIYSHTIQLYGWNSQVFSSYNTFISDSPLRFVKTRPLTDYGMHCTSVGYSKDNTDTLMGTSIVKNSTFNGHNYLSVYDAWVKYSRTINNTFTNCRYGIHGHGENVLSDGNTLTLDANSQYNKQWSYGNYLYSYSAPVRTEFQTQRDNYKTSSAVSKAICRNTTFNNYYINAYIGSDNASVKNITVNGNSHLSETDPNFNYNHGIYVNGWGKEFTLKGSDNITLNNCWWGVQGHNQKLITEDLTVSNQQHGLYWYGGDVVMRNSSISNNQGWGAHLAGGTSYDIENCTFSSNAKKYGAWGLYAYSKKTPRTKQTPGDLSYNPWDETYLYGSYTGTIRLVNCKAYSNGVWPTESDGTNTQYTEDGTPVSGNNLTTPVWAGGIGLHYFATHNMSGNEVKYNYGYGAYLGDGTYTLSGNTEFSAITGNYFGLACQGYWSENAWTGQSNITGYTISGNKYGLYFYSTTGTISNTTVSNNELGGMYASWSALTMNNFSATNNEGVGLGAYAMRNCSFTNLNCKGNKKSWGASIYTFEKYGVAQTKYEITIRNSTFNNNTYGGLALGAYRHEQNSSGSWVWNEAQNYQFDVQDTTCNGNQHYGFHTYYCWIKDGVNLGITANNNGTLQYNADGTPVLNAAQVQEPYWGVGVYAYKINQTLSLTKTQGFTVEGNSRHGWLNYYDPVVIEDMYFGPNGNFGYNPAVNNGTYYGYGYGFYSAWNPSIVIRNTECVGSGIQVLHMDNLEVNNLTTDGAYMGFQPYWGYKDGNNKVWQPSSFSIANCEFKNGWYGYYQYSYDQGARVPHSISNVTATGNIWHGIFTHNTHMTIRNLQSNNNGYAGLYCYGGNVDIADSNVSGNTSLKDEAGNYRGYYGTVFYDWTRPFTYTVNNCNFNDNQGYGLYIGNDEDTATATIANCQFNNNRYHGYLGSWLNSSVTDCVANSNGATTGHYGFCIDSASGTFTNCQANDNNGLGFYSHGRYGYETITRDDGTTYTEYFSTRNDVANFTNCEAQRNQHSGFYGVYAISNFQDCQAIGNTIYGIHTGHDDQNQTYTATVQNCTITDNGNIGLYGWDTRLTVTNVALDRNYHGLYFPSPQSEGDALIMSNCTSNDNKGWGLLTYYQKNVNIAQVQANNNGFVNGGGGALLHYDDNDIVTNCTFNGNNSMGLYPYYSKNTQIECVFSQNNKSYGLHIWNANKSIVKNSVFTGNEYGVLMDDVLNGGEMWNCTIANSVTYIGFRPYRGNIKLHNSVIANNNRYGIHNDNLGTFTHTHNLVYGHATGTDYWQSGMTNEKLLVGPSEIRKPPRFVNPAAGDFRLAKGSPAINSGLEAPGVVDSDLLGNVRPMYRKTEMGAYEFTDPSGSVRITEWNEVR